MSQDLITVAEFERVLPSICGRDTTLDDEGWHKDNPLLGHCAVVSAVAQKLFGGRLLRASLEGTPYSSMGSHYVNLLPTGEIKDFTAPQFTQGYPDLEFDERERSYVLGYDKTAQRNAILALRLAAHLKGENPLFEDEIYRTCITEALRSPCQKMGFGSVVVHDGSMVARDTNRKIDGLEHLCDPACIRLQIQSRTESMLGACGHSEEWALKGARDEGIPLGESVLYVAGVQGTGMPYIKTEPVHTCLRCSVQMNYAGLAGVGVPVNDGWEVISTKEALRTASEYATRAKTV